MLPALYLDEDRPYPWDVYEEVKHLRLVETIEEAKDLAVELDTLLHDWPETIFALDTEFEGIDFKKESNIGKGRVVTLQLAFIDPEDPNEEIQRVWVDCRDLNVLFVLREWIGSNARKVLQNYMIDAHALANHGCTLRGLWADTLQMSRLLDPERLSHMLDGNNGLAVQILGRPRDSRPTTKEALATHRIGVKGNVLKSVELLPMSEMVEDEEMRPFQQVYSTNDVLDTLELYFVLRERMEALEWRGDGRGLWGYYDDFHRDLQEVLFRMMRRGMCIDEELAQDLRVSFEESIEDMQAQLWEWAECPLNWRSPQQVAWLLYGWDYRTLGSGKNIVDVCGKGFPPPDPRNAAEEKKLEAFFEGHAQFPSTDKEAIEHLIKVVDDEEDVRHLKLMQQRSKMSKLVSGTLVPLTEKLRARHATGVREIDKTYKYIYGYFDIVARTGRLASKLPNLQNVPTRSKEGGMIRQAFTCERGEVILCRDFSQLELRILSFYLKTLFGDLAMAEDLATGDLHQATADRLGMARKIAKNLNFAVVYGATKWKLAHTFGVPVEQAEIFMTEYFKGYPGIPRYQRWSHQRCRDTGAARTILGRYRFLPGIYAQNRRVRAAAERRAGNTPIQGSAQDICMLAMLAVDEDEELKDYGFSLRLQVHDELVGVCKAKYAEEALARMGVLMESALPPDQFGGIELPTDGHFGMTWAEAKDGKVFADG